MRRMRRSLLAWLAARPLLHRDAALGWTLIHAGLPPQWTLDAGRGLRARGGSARCATTRRRCSRTCTATGPTAGRARSRASTACASRQLPDAAAIRGPQGAAAARLKGSIADAPQGAMPVVPASRAQDARRPRSSSATGRRSAISPSRACARSTRVVSGADRSRRSGSTARQSRCAALPRQPAARR